MTTEPYKTHPIEIVNGIPVFSRIDRYIENYQKIANDHISQMKPGAENPFIEQDLWVNLEDSTRELIKKHIPPGSKILDIGVGLGRVLEPLTEYKRYGMDISHEYLAISKAKGFEVAFSKIEDMPYQDGYFDAVICCDVLEHVIDLYNCVLNILKTLRPGGILLIRVPYRENLESYLLEDSPYEFIHLRSFDVPSLRLLFEKVTGMGFVETVITSPYFQSASRLKLQLLPELSRKKLAVIANNYAELDLLRNNLETSAEEFASWLYDLRERHRAVFELIAPDLLLGMEVNAVFVKLRNSDVLKFDEELKNKNIF